MNEEETAEKKRAGSAVLSMLLGAVILMAVAFFFLQRQWAENEFQRAQITVLKQEIVALQQQAELEESLLEELSTLRLELEAGE